MEFSDCPQHPLKNTKLPTQIRSHLLTSEDHSPTFKFTFYTCLRLCLYSGQINIDFPQNLQIIETNKQTNKNLFWLDAIVPLALILWHNHKCLQPVSLQMSGAQPGIHIAGSC